MLRKLSAGFGLALVLGAALACGRHPATPENAISPVAIEASLGNKFVKAGASQPLLARITLSTERRTSNVRPPVNVALVIDTSGSMEGRAIEDARAAALALLDSLGKEDRLAVIVFHSKAETLLPSTRIEDADMKELRAKIGAMKAQGTTDMGQGLRLALDAVEANFVKQGVNRIVMLGDGVPNDDQNIGSITAEASGRGVSITTLGLGNDYDEILMGRISQQTGGKFSYVEDSTKVASFFKEEVVRLHKVVAKNAILELHPGPGVVVQNVIGRPSQRVNHGMQVLLGDLTLGEQHELVVELATNPTKDGSTVEALDAVLRWQDGVGGETHEERVFVGAKATTDEARIAAGKDEKVTDAVARAKDAAATLQKLEEQRNVQRNERSNLDNLAAPDQAAKGGGAGAHPTKTPMPSPVANAPRMPADEVRRAHSQAIQNFQAY